MDYSPLGRLLESRIAVEPDGSLPEHASDGEIAGKVVLVGYATPDKTTDMVRVPGREDEVPGVFAHASAVHKLVERPSFALKSAGSRRSGSTLPPSTKAIDILMRFLYK